MNVVWPIIAIILGASLIGLHLWWLRRYRLLESTAQAERADLKAEQARAGAQQSSRLDTLINSMAEGLLLLDRTGRVELANRAAVDLFGLAKDVRGRTILETVRLHELANLVESLGTEKQVLGYELRLSHPTERWIQVNGAAVTNDKDERQGTVLVFHDVTRLIQLENARKDFVANVSHELRTPLSLIKGYCETLLDGARENPELSLKFLESIDRNSERLRLLIEDLLTISELESGGLTMRLQPLQLNGLVQDVFHDFQERAATRRTRLVNRVPEIRVNADPTRLEQVLRNLIDNAIKYGRNEGTVEVLASIIEGDYVEVCVQDDGPGIPPQALDRVFERFFRVDKARSREQGGTGLGLSIVKHIVQGHFGRVWAKSELGRGAAFFFTLRAAPPPGSPSSEN